MMKLKLNFLISKYKKIGHSRTDLSEQNLCNYLLYIYELNLEKFEKKNDYSIFTLIK